MTYSIAFCGVDGAGKTTLINKVSRELEIPVDHMNKFMKNFYTHQQSKAWEICNLFELIIRNIIWRFRLQSRSLIMDRCYICSLTFSEMEGYPKISREVKSWAVKPDIILLMEPVEELVDNAYAFTKSYKKTLTSEGYVKFFYGSYIFGRISYWKQPETRLTRTLKSYLGVIEHS